MKGQRLPDGSDWSTSTPAGAYWRDRGRWFAVTPDGSLVDVTTWTVTEHEDGSITVSPSILVHAREGATYDAEQRARIVQSKGEEQVQAWERGKPEWHGFLERGEWRSC